jgi:hypothetical protein
MFRAKTPRPQRSRASQCCVCSWRSSRLGESKSGLRPKAALRSQCPPYLGSKDSRQTNPISGLYRPATLSPRTSIRGDDLPCQTNPIGRAGVHPVSPRLGHGGHRAKRSQFRASPAAGRGPIVPNKANCTPKPPKTALKAALRTQRMARSNRAKQSQFGWDQDRG